MNWDTIQGNWKQFEGGAIEQWGRLTRNDWEIIAGQKDQLLGRLQELYGITRDEANRQIENWCQTRQNRPVSR